MLPMIQSISDRHNMRLDLRVSSVFGGNDGLARPAEDGSRGNSQMTKTKNHLRLPLRSGF